MTTQTINSSIYKNVFTIKYLFKGFDEAMLIFADPFLLMNQDIIENGEVRWQSIGEIEGIAVILVAHTWYDDDGEEYIRIISARPADKKEKMRYEQSRYSNY